VVELSVNNLVILVVDVTWDYLCINEECFR
jgi:hypothetical protein